MHCQKKLVLMFALDSDSSGNGSETLQLKLTEISDSKLQQPVHIRLSKSISQYVYDNSLVYEKDFPWYAYEQ